MNVTEQFHKTEGVAGFVEVLDGNLDSLLSTVVTRAC